MIEVLINRKPGIYTDVYLAKYLKIPKHVRDQIGIFHVITRAYHRSSLSPSLKLLKEYKHGFLSWTEYVERFLEEIRNNETALKTIAKYREEAQSQAVFLVCYEKNASRCHRSIIKQIIDHEIDLFPETKQKKITDYLDNKEVESRNE